MIDINKIQLELRELLKKGKVEEAIENFDKYLNSQKITDSYVSDALISISSSYRGLIQLKIKAAIDYGTYTSERNKITDRILGLIRDLPFIRPKPRANLNLAKVDSTLISDLEDFQEVSFRNIREELLSVDNLMINLFREISEKEKLLIKQKNEAQVTVLKTEVELLEKRINEEKKRYNELKERYEKLKQEKEKTDELVKEIGVMNKQLEVKDENIKILEERFIFSERVIQQKDAELKVLKKELDLLGNKDISFFDESIIIKKAYLLVSIVIVLVLIVILGIE